MKNKQRKLPFLLLLFSLIFLQGCTKCYLSVQKEIVNRNSLASTFVGSPDPLQTNPSKGEKLILQWWIPSSLLKKQPQLLLHLFYKDFSQETVTFSMPRRKGVNIFSLLNEKYQEKRGLLSYKAEILSKEGEMLREWRHFLWFELITIDSDKKMEEKQMGSYDEPLIE